jgi:hypothetical protein
MIPGIVENWNMVVDLKDVGMTDIPIKAVKAIIANGSKNFRGRMYR